MSDNGEYTVGMDSFFAGFFARNEQDMALLCGVLAELEGVDKSSVRVSVRALDASGGTDLSDELANAIGTD